MALTSPYNFVPLNSKVYIPDWYNLVSQDIPFEDGEDGYIELTWHNDSPLFIRDKDKDDPEHAPMNINGRYFIPGSSIKGMLRNVLSILAFGKMKDGEQYKSQTFQKIVIINDKKTQTNRKFSIEDLVNKRQPQIVDNSGKPDLCELIFGWVSSDSRSMKGRVQVGNAFALKNENIELIHEKTIVLGQPQASYFPLYIKQDQNTDKPKTYDNGECISGRKRYRIHKGFTEPKNVEPGDTTSTFKAIPAGYNFVTRINLHNMRPAEIGALLSAITIHNTKDVYHNIGAAKAFGYGKIRLEGEVKLFGLNYTLSYYLKAFEDTMEEFYDHAYPISSNYWKTSEEITTLLGTMAEHKYDDVRFMNPNEYKDAKKSNKGKLNENTSARLQSVSVQEYEKSKKSHVSTCELKAFADKIVEETDDLQQKIEALTKLNKYICEVIDYRKFTQEQSNTQDTSSINELQSQIEDSIYNLRLEQFEILHKQEYDKIDEYLTGIEELITSGKIDYANSILKLAKDQCDLLCQSLDENGLTDQRIIDKIDLINKYKIQVENTCKDLGLRGKLDKKDVNGKDLITDWKLCNKIINKYKSKKPEGRLNEQDINDIIDKAKRLYDDSQEADCPDVNWRKNGRNWNELANYLGKERADALFKELDNTK